MVLEKLFKESWVEKKPLISFFLGTVITILSYISSYLVFKNNPNMIGIGTIFFIVISAIPGINNLFNLEEQEEADKYDNFLKDHESILDFFLYFFLGMFWVFLLLST